MIFFNLYRRFYEIVTIIYYVLQSSLIQAILRELPLSGGVIHVRGVISYASQEPWIFAGSVQQNIVFNSPMDKDRYKQVNICPL